jgi:hypothetical protein
MKVLQSLIEEKVDEQYKEKITLYLAEDYFNEYISILFSILINIALLMNV